MKMLRQLPRLLRFIPGTAQDVRAYFLALQYWLAGSEENLANLVRLLVDRYAVGPRRAALPALRPAAPVQYPDVGLYHPRASGRIVETLDRLPAAGDAGTVGLLVMRSYVLAGNSAHYDGVIAALEDRGLRVVPAFASGLDARPAIERYFTSNGAATVDAIVSLTGFSLVGGPAYNDARAAEALLAALDVPYVAAHPVEFQTLQQWQADARGLTPVEATMMVAIPELDGAIWPMTFGGRSGEAGDRRRDMAPHAERAASLASRVARLVALRRRAAAERKIAIVLFNFPPNAGSVGTAAHLAVFESLHHTLRALAAAGYRVEVPDTVDRLRERITGGNAARFGGRPTSPRESPPTIMSGASLGSPRSSANGARRPAASRATAAISSCSASDSAMSSSASSRRSATKATRCGCCSSGASRRRMPLPRSIAGCARISAPTRCCISALTARSNSCPASRPACPARAGRTG